MVLYSSNAVDLYIGRIFAGATGGGMYICLPLFVAEVADQRLVARVHFHPHSMLIARCHGDVRFELKNKFMHLHQHSVHMNESNENYFCCCCYRIRGRLGSLLMLSVTIGILFGFIAGTYLTYYLVPKIFLPLPIVFFVLFIFFPETPQYYIKRKSFDVMYKTKPTKTKTKQMKT